MTYQKPLDVSYTDMAIFIDNNIYSEKEDIKCFEYMYHLFYMFAVKKCLFNHSRDYDDYSLYAASKLFSRYKKKNLDKIKSSLNYIKNTYYALVVDFRKENFSEALDNSYETKVELKRKVLDSNTQINRFEIKCYLSSIKYRIKEEVENSPFKDKNIIHNLYLSCLLTFCNILTYSKTNKKRLDNLTGARAEVEEVGLKLLKEESGSDVILFHLDDSLRNYVDTLVKKIKHNMAEDILYLIHSNNLDDSVIEDIMRNVEEKDID